jgi:transcriptional regulator with XRE-family HTH domain
LCGLSQAEFGAKLGVSKDKIFNYENERADPDELTISTIAELASVEIGELVNNKLKPSDIKIREIGQIKRSGAVPDHRDEIIVLLKEKCDRLEKDYSDSVKQLSLSLDSLAAGQEAIAQVQTESLQVLFELLKGKLKDKSADELMTTVLDRSFANQEKAGKRGKSFDGNKSRR